eukprot:290098_1
MSQQNVIPIAAFEKKNVLVESNGNNYDQIIHTARQMTANNYFMSCLVYGYIHRVQHNPIFTYFIPNDIYLLCFIFVDLDIDDSYKICVGIDFGSHGSTLSYALPADFDEDEITNVFIHNIWKDIDGNSKKTKTSVLFDDEGYVHCVGHQSIYVYVQATNNKG